jgi:hypothetical protein
MEKEASSRFRDLINDFFIRSEFLYEGQTISKVWNRICICMDILQNTERACVSFFSKNKEDISYLELYGFFQSLYLQQDSVERLYKTIVDNNFKIKKIAELDTISKYRNCYAGHPIDKKENKQVTSHGLASYVTDDFHLQTYSWGDNGGLSNIKLKEVYKNQENEIDKLLKVMIKKLETMIQEKIDKLKTIDTNIDMNWGLFSGSFYNRDIPMAEHHFNGLKEKVKKIMSEVISIFGGKLEEAQTMDVLFSELDYCLENFPGFDYNVMNNRIYLYFLENKLEELKLFFEELP